MTIHQDAKLYIGVFNGAQEASMTLAPDRLVYVHVAQGLLNINGIRMNAGDAMKLSGEADLTLDRGEQAEVLVFDLPQWPK